MNEIGLVTIEYSWHILTKTNLWHGAVERHETVVHQGIWAAEHPIPSNSTIGELCEVYARQETPTSGVWISLPTHRVDLGVFEFVQQEVSRKPGQRILQTELFTDSKQTTCNHHTVRKQWMRLLEKHIHQQKSRKMTCLSPLNFWVTDKVKLWRGRGSRRHVNFRANTVAMVKNMARYALLFQIWSDLISIASSRIDSNRAGRWSELRSAEVTDLWHFLNLWLSSSSGENSAGLWPGFTAAKFSSSPWQKGLFLIAIAWTALAKLEVRPRADSPFILVNDGFVVQSPGAPLWLVVQAVLQRFPPGDSNSGKFLWSSTQLWHGSQLFGIRTTSRWRPRWTRVRVFPVPI